VATDLWPSSGIADSSRSAAEDPCQTEPRDCFAVVGLGAHECLGDDPMARASKTRQDADEREATPGVGRLSLRPEPISRRPRGAFVAREDGAFAFPVRCEPCRLFHRSELTSGRSLRWTVARATKPIGARIRTGGSPTTIAKATTESAGYSHPMPDGHAPFAVWNRTGNRAVELLLRSPLHPVVSRQLALITVTGRRSGHDYTFPVGYRRTGDRVTIPVMWPARKVWWRNLQGGARVRLRLAGEQHSGLAEVRGDERSGVSVEVQLDPGS
jgi:F420H(2)-dependent quinone reductase